jgi:hypothetical protein
MILSQLSIDRYPVIFEISGSYGDDYEVGCLLGPYDPFCCYSPIYAQLFQSVLSFPSSFSTKI